jgi:hypothetical protein
MKLIIATSLGQGWLINHPECSWQLHTCCAFHGLLSKWAAS